MTNHEDETELERNLRLLREMEERQNLEMLQKANQEQLTLSAELEDLLTKFHRILFRL